MKKLIKILIPVLILAVLIGGVLVYFSHAVGWDAGVLLKTEKGALLWIDENGSPVQLSFVKSIAEKQARKLQTGDAVLLLHDGIMETYPAATGCYFILKTGGGKEIPADTLKQLDAMGWLGTPVPGGDTSVPEGATAVEYATGENTVPDPVYATCGNTLTVIKKDGKEYRFMYENSVALFNLLGNLSYGGKPYAEGLYPDDFTVLLEDGVEYRVSLANAKACALSGSELFNREAGGTAILSKAQCEQIADIVSRVEKGEKGMPVPPADPAADQVVTPSTKSLVGDAAAEFGVKVIRELYSGSKEENVVLSPLSLYSVLLLAANGAAGETRTQLEGVLGGASAAELTGALKELVGDLTAGKEVRIANGIWVKDRYVKLNGEYAGLAQNDFHAVVRPSALDEAGVKEINAWVNEQTDGRIKELIAPQPEEALMVLVNALSFNAYWQQKYTAARVREGVFAAANGKRQNVNMMYSDENAYFETEFATGFSKPYAGSAYAFAAFLPKDGVSVEELLESLSGGALSDLLRSPEIVPVNAAIPQFSCEYGAELNGVLQTLGARDAFDWQKADFSSMGSFLPPYDTACISNIVQKTAIDVTPAGTSAAAASAVEMTGAAAFPDQKTVTLDRPFVFVLYQISSAAPLMLGLLNQTE